VNFDVSKLKVIDHRLGWPLCVLLSVICGLFHLVFGPPKKPKIPRSVLVIKFFGLGSIGYSTLIPHDLKKQFPGLVVDLLTFEENRRFTENLHSYDHVICIEKRSFSKFFLGTVRTLLTHFFLRPYDICIDLEFFSKYTTLHTVFTRSPMRIGFYMHCLWRRHIYTDVAFFNLAKHIRRVYGTISMIAGAESSDQQPAMLSVSQEMISKVRRRIEELGWDGKQPLVGININASDLALGRRWPPDRFASVAERIVDRGPLVCFTGAPSEREYVDDCIKFMATDLRNSTLNLAGVLDIYEFIAFLKISSLFLTGDSGPMIFSVLADAPSVSLWGPGDPEMFGGNQPLHTSIYTSFPCSPCMYIPNTDAGIFCKYRFPCMLEVSEDAVLQEVFRRLEPAS
jgi:ADP-heptose:LPS heptosyltransferase